MLYGAIGTMLKPSTSNEITAHGNHSGIMKASNLFVHVNFNMEESSVKGESNQGSFTFPTLR